MRYFLLGLAMIASAMIAISTKLFHYPLRGLVVNANNQPVARATVTEKNSSNSTTSLADGSFNISLSRQHSVIIVSAAGYKTAEVSTAGKSKLTVVLQAGLSADTAIEEEKAQDVMLESIAMSAPPASAANKSKMPFTNASPAYKLATDFNNEGYNTEDYDAIIENSFHSVAHDPLSTFSIDVDAASYSNIRRYLNQGQMPPAGSVRIEEMINYFHYDYPQPLDDAPFSVTTEMAACPWNTTHQLIRIGLQGKKVPVNDLPSSNLVFLIDVSGSMMPENKLPLVKTSMKMLVDQLREKDRVAIVVYAGNAGLVLPSTTGDKKMLIKNAIDNLEAGGSTAGGEGIKLAYSVAGRSFIEGGNNRVILCTDGDFNVGASSDAALEEMISNERQSNIFLTVLGVGMGNYKDNKMQKLADKGNGNHAYIDGLNEAKKVLVNEFGGTLFTIAKDVKLQVEFNPARVQSYRLVGYENRMLNKQDFNDDKKDAGELGSGHNVTALYEVIPIGVHNDFPDNVDSLVYSRPLMMEKRSSAVDKLNTEVLTVKLRYKNPQEDKSKLLVHKLENSGGSMQTASADFRFAAGVAEFGMLLRNSEFRQQSSYESALALASQGLGKDVEGYRHEFLGLVKAAKGMDAQVRSEEIRRKNLDAAKMIAKP